MNEKQKPSIIHKELERRSQDRIKVANPTSEDYEVIWDGYAFTVPANGTAIHPRYIAEKYVKEMTEKVITDMADSKIDEINEQREKEGKEKMTAQQREIKELRTSNKALRDYLEDKLDLGVVEEYGVGVEKVRGELPKAKLDKRLKSELDEVLTDVETTKPRKEEDIVNEEKLESKSQFELRKIAREMGVETKKTDKKAEIINAISEK